MVLTFCRRSLTDFVYFYLLMRRVVALLSSVYKVMALLI